MDGVFMRNFLKAIIICQILLCLIVAGMLLADKQTLSNDVIRLHVVGNSNSEADQMIKLQVRDAVVAYLQEPLSDVKNAQEAKLTIKSKLNDLEMTVNQVLAEAGCKNVATISLGKEKFDVRHYETFSLPSGVYESLRVSIGEGNGKNWWCVVFPGLCMQASAKDMRAEAVSSGFSASLTRTLSDPDYEISFFLLDCIGKLENLFYFK